MINFSPDFCPRTYALAIIIADAFVDFGMIGVEDWPELVIEHGLHTTAGWQLLIRALLFHLVSRSELVTGRLGNIREKEAERYSKAAGGARVAVLQFDGDDKARAAQLRSRLQLP